MSEAVEIINGNLANTPAIAGFNSIATSIGEVKRGCLFIAKNPNEIDGAVALGAYGVVYDRYVQMVDGEIAWIKVVSIADAIIRLVRYKFLTEKIEVIFASEIQYDIALEIITDSAVGFFDEGIFDLLGFMGKNTNLKAIVIKNKNLLNFALEHTSINQPQEFPFKIATATLFETKINYKFAQYELRLPNLFLPELSGVIELCVTQNIAFDLKKYSSIPHMQPNFINACAKLVSYGQTDRVVIAQKNIEDFKRYITYIALKAKWGKLMLFLPEGYEEVFDVVAQNEIYHNENELANLLKKQIYNFALIFGLNNSALTKILMTPQIEPVLPLY